MPKCRVSGCAAKSNNVVFNILGQKGGVCCVEHKEQDMIDITRKLCEEPGCATRASYAKEAEKVPRFCLKHKEDDMINVTETRKCAHDGCSTRPTFNVPGEKVGLYCKEHSKDGMQDVISRKCSHAGCNKQPHYNNPGEKKAMYCKEHSTQGMVDVRNKKCAYETCQKQPIYNIAGEKKGMYCKEHSSEGMINVLDRKCIQEACNTIVGSKYNGYCLRCFLYIHPDHKISKNYRIKEGHVADFLNKQFDKNNIVHDQRILGGCSKRRPDFLIDMLTHSIVVEVDESQHNRSVYNCENKRLMEIFQDLGNRPLVIIRFNPDGYIDDKGVKHVSCFSMHKKLDVPYVKEKKEWEERLQTLHKIVRQHIKTIPSKEITLEFLYFDA